MSCLIQIFLTVIFIMSSCNVVDAVSDETWTRNDTISMVIAAACVVFYIITRFLQKKKLID